MGNTQIPYAEKVWNPVVGCSPAGAGCANCWAARLASTRLAHLWPYKGLAKAGRWMGRVRCNVEHVEDPIHWRKPQRIFVASMGDVLHEQVDLAVLEMLWNIMRVCDHHTFVVFTKRVGRLIPLLGPTLPILPNVWLIASASTQAEVDQQTGWLVQCLARIRGLSLEPLLESVNVNLNGLSWVIVGGESGPNARYFDPRWGDRIRRQCKAVGVAYYAKQMGSWWGRMNADPANWPDELRVREIPE